MQERKQINKVLRKSTALCLSSSNGGSAGSGPVPHGESIKYKKSSRRIGKDQ